jgi:hypothetical protein
LKVINKISLTPNVKKLFIRSWFQLNIINSEEHNNISIENDIIWKQSNATLKLKTGKPEVEDILDKTPNTSTKVRQSNI